MNWGTPRDAAEEALSEHRIDACPCQRCYLARAVITLLDENVALRAALQEAVDSFYQNTHPGFPAKQSGHVRVETINRWKQALGDAS